MSETSIDKYECSGQGSRLEVGVIVRQQGNTSAAKKPRFL